MLRKFALLVTLSVLLLSVATGSIVYASETEYRLGAQDRLRIYVQDWPNVSGEFIIGPEGNISLPILGEIRATSLRTSELAKAISARLAAKANEPLGLKTESGQGPDTSIEVIAFRPFYILGAVSKPGDYPYRPGMSVIHALSIAGGIYRKEAGVLRIERDVISGHGELDILIQKRGELRARSARLSAEAEGKDAISLPPDLVDQKTNPHFVGIVATERLLFRARRETLQSQVQSIRKRIELNAKEIDSLNAQIEAEQKQFGSVEKELNEVRVMVSRGLAPAPRQLAAERTLAEIEGKQLGLKTLIVRAEQNTSQFEQQIIDLESQFRTGVTIELQQVRMHLIEVERKIATTASLIKEAQDTALETEDVPPDRRSLSYTIIRKGPDGVREFSATEHSDVEPGDVIKVLMGMKSDLAQTGEPAAQASPYRQQAEALRK